MNIFVTIKLLLHRTTVKSNYCYIELLFHRTIVTSNYCFIELLLHRTKVYKIVHVFSELLKQKPYNHFLVKFQDSTRKSDVTL